MVECSAWRRESGRRLSRDQDPRSGILILRIKTA
jgi:hypothetical protein